MSTSSTSSTGTSNAIRFEMGAQIFRQGEEAAQVYVVTTGLVRIERRVHREAVTLDHVGPGSVFGEVAMVAGSHYPVSAIAVEDSMLAVVSRDDLIRRMSEQPELALRIARKLAVRLTHAQFRAGTWSLASPEARVMLQLLNESERNGAEEDDRLVAIPWDIAPVLGLEESVVDQVIRSLARRGLLEVDGAGFFRIIDRSTWSRRLHYLELSSRFGE